MLCSAEMSAWQIVAHLSQALHCLLGVPTRMMMMMNGTRMNDAFITSIALLAGSSYKNDDDDEWDQDEWCIYHEHCTACWEFLQEWWWWWMGPGWMMHLSRALHCLLGVPTRMMMMMNGTRMNDAFITSIALLAGSSYKNDDDDEWDQDEWCIYQEHCTACWEFLQEWWWWMGPGWMMHLSRALHCLLGVPTRMMMMMNGTRMNDAFITSIALLAGSSCKNDDDELDQDEWCIYHEHCTACWEFQQEWWWWMGPGWMKCGKIGKVGDHAILVTLVCFAWEQASTVLYENLFTELFHIDYSSLISINCQRVYIFFPRKCYTYVTTSAISDIDCAVYKIQQYAYLDGFCNSSSSQALTVIALWRLALLLLHACSVSLADMYEMTDVDGWCVAVCDMLCNMIMQCDYLKALCNISFHVCCPLLPKYVISHLLRSPRTMIPM